MMYTGTYRLETAYKFIFILVAVTGVFACSVDESVTDEPPASAGNNGPEEEFQVRQWYPTPKPLAGATYQVMPMGAGQAPAYQQQPYQYGQVTTAGRPANTTVVGQPLQPQSTSHAYPQSAYVQPGWPQQPPVQSGWQPTYPTYWSQAQDTPAYTTGTYPPAWPQSSGNVVPVQPQGYYVQQQQLPAVQGPSYPSQLSGYPQQYQYGVPAPVQDPYAQRPWGAVSAEQNSAQQRKSIDSWQTVTQPQAWGVPGYGAAQPQYYQQYGGYQGTVTPGYAW